MDIDAHKEKCLFWARVYEMPYGVWSTINGKWTKTMCPPADASLFAAEALRYYATTRPAK